MRRRGRLGAADYPGQRRWRCDVPAQHRAWPSEYGNANICGESNIGNWALLDDPPNGFQRQCFNALQWSAAKDVCVGSGARLCTVEEIHADETRGTGCNGDLRMVWSLDDVGCDSEEHVQVPGSVTCDLCDPLAVPQCSPDRQRHTSDSRKRRKR